MHNRPETWRSLSPQNREFAISHTRHMIESLVRHKNIPIYELKLEKTDDELAQWVFTNRNAILSLGAEAEPSLNYGNSQALMLWGKSFDEFVKTPSKSIIKAGICQEDTKILTQLHKEGMVYPYSGIGIAKNDSRLLIKDARIWTVEDEMQNRIGVAAMFPDWEFAE